MKDDPRTAGDALPITHYALRRAPITHHPLPLFLRARGSADEPVGDLRPGHEDRVLAPPEAGEEALKEADAVRDAHEVGVQRDGEDARPRGALLREALQRALEPA